MHMLDEIKAYRGISITRSNNSTWIQMITAFEDVLLFFINQKKLPHTMENKNWRGRRGVAATFWSQSAPWWKQGKRTASPDVLARETCCRTGFWERHSTSRPQPGYVHTFQFADSERGGEGGVTAAKQANNNKRWFTHQSFAVHKMRYLRKYFRMLLCKACDCASSTAAPKSNCLCGPFQKVLVGKLHIQQCIGHVHHFASFGFVRMQFQHHHRESVSSDWMQVPLQRLQQLAFKSFYVASVVAPICDKLRQESLQCTLHTWMRAYTILTKRNSGTRQVKWWT